MRGFAKLALGMAAAVALSAALQPALAACGGAPVITSYNEAGDLSLIWSSTSDWNTDFPGSGNCLNYGCYDHALTDNFGGVFWRLGSGDPAAGVGDDNGATYPVSQWLVRDSFGGGGTYWYPSFLNGSWNLAGDGCLDGANDIFGPEDCMCVLLTDSENGIGQMALLGAVSDGIGNSRFWQPGSAPVVLAPMPKVEITNSVRGPSPNFDVQLDVVVNAPTAGVYDECGCGPVQYRLHRKVTPRNAGSGDSRALGDWTQVAGPLPIGTPVIGHDVACGGVDSDVYLTASLIFDSGFSTTIVSGNSTRVECGPNIATPEELHRPIRLPSRVPAPKKGGAR